MSDGIRIQRPPAVKTFALPSHEKILSLRVGDLVKLIFVDDDGNGERMWVRLSNCSEPDKWIGELWDTGLLIALNLGAKIEFHPYDIIEVRPQEASASSK